MLELEHRLVANGGRDRGLHDVAIVGVDVSLHPVPLGFVRVRDELAALEMTHLGPVGVHPVDDIRRCGGQGSKALVAFF